MSETGVVYVVDDDTSVRKTAARLFKSVGLDVELFSSAREFLDHPRPSDSPGCLVLDLRMPGLSGLDLQHELDRVASDLPIVFMTGHGDVPTAVRAMKSGAVDFLPKPVDPDVLVRVVREGIARHRAARLARDELIEAQRALDTLTPREREVMSLVVQGLLNKQIALRLGISLSTVKAHRRRVMDKSGCESLADLVRMAEKIGMTTSDSEVVE